MKPYLEFKKENEASASLNLDPKHLRLFNTPEIHFKENFLSLLLLLDYAKEERIILTMNRLEDYRKSKEAFFTDLQSLQDSLHDLD